ncbi:MAG: hypothetical protein CWE10_10140 [Symbiobacterium thermophilum]|nr:hypothetical protein [Symbiobacterium thermophilum]
MSWRDDHDRRSGLCADLEDDRDCGCGGHGWNGRHDQDGGDRWDGDHGHGHHDHRGDHDHHGHHDHHHNHHGGHDGHHHRHRRRQRRLIPIGSVTVDCTPVTFRTPGQAINVVSCPVSWIIPGTRCIATIHTPPVQTPVLPIHRHRKACGCH